MELDQYCRRVAREAPAHLKEGGYLQMVCEWVQIGGGGVLAGSCSGMGGGDRL